MFNKNNISPNAAAAEMSGSAAQVRTWHQPAEMPRFADMTVTADGKPLDVIESPMPQNRLVEANRAPYAYAMFESDGPAELAINAGGKTLTERVPGPGHYVFEPNGRHRALVVTVFGKKQPAPAKDANGVVYFGPGIHRKNVLRLAAGETLYLDEGAVLEARVIGEGDDIRLAGRGIISGAKWPHEKGPVEDPATGGFSGDLVHLTGNDIHVEDVTLFSSYGWTLHLVGVTNAVVDNVSIICGRVINDDGIDIARAKDVVVRNSFVRTQDDCIAPKWFCENLLVTNCVLWCDVANAVRIGWECEKPPRRFHNLVFRDLDIIHLSLQPGKPDDFWSDAAFLLQAANGITMDDIKFENIRIRETGNVEKLAIIKTMGFKFNENYSPLEPGYVRDVTFKNVTCPADKQLPLYLKPQDEQHSIENVH